MELKLDARPPFSLPAVVRSHGWVDLAPFGQDERTGGLTYVTRLETGRVVGLCITDAPEGVRVEYVRAATAQMSHRRIENGSVAFTYLCPAE